MASFLSLYEAAVGQDHWDNKTEYNEDMVRGFVKRGLELRPDRDGESFWDDFIRLFGENQSSAAEMFGVRPEAISRAVRRARELKDEVADENDMTGKKKKRHMTYTGQ